MSSVSLFLRALCLTAIKYGLNSHFRKPAEDRAGCKMGGFCFVLFPAVIGVGPGPFTGAFTPSVEERSLSSREPRIRRPDGWEKVLEIEQHLTVESKHLVINI